MLVLPRDGAGNPSTVHWAQHPDLLNTTSLLYQAQCGDYRSETNPMGYISGPRMVANNARHEGGALQSHWSCYSEAQQRPDLNPGVVGENLIGPPSERYQDFFNRATASVTKAIGDISMVTKPEPPNSAWRCDATGCEFQGKRNVHDPGGTYAPCS